MPRTWDVSLRSCTPVRRWPEGQRAYLRVRKSIWRRHTRKSVPLPPYGIVRKSAFQPVRPCARPWPERTPVKRYGLRPPGWAFRSWQAAASFQESYPVGWTCLPARTRRRSGSRGGCRGRPAHRALQLTLRRHKLQAAGACQTRYTGCPSCRRTHNQSRSEPAALHIGGKPMRNFAQQEHSPGKRQAVRIQQCRPDCKRLN